MDSVNDKAIPLRLSDAKIGGVLGKLIDKYIDARFLSDFARRVIYEEALAPFLDFADDNKGTWRGEFWGKHMLGAVEAYKYTGDERLKEFLRLGALKLLSLARDDGYINTYSDSLNLFVKEQGISNTEKCVNIPWNWNLWCRKYTLWGLAAIYEITLDKEILSGAERFAIQMVNELSEAGVSLRETGMFFGLPSSSVLKPLLLLYRYTKNDALLSFAVEKICGEWERADGACPNLITNALSGVPVHEWYDTPSLWAKAYEMMSCYEGILELYRITKEEKYLRAVICFYELISEHERNPLFSVAYNDMFAGAESNINGVSEPCDSIHYMRLGYELYLLTGDPRYIDDFELTYYNAFLAGVFRDTVWASRAVRARGRHMWTRQCRMNHHHCCLDNAPRGLLRMAEAAITYLDGFVTVNLFDELSGTVKYADGECSVTVGDGYFRGAPVKLSFVTRGERRPIRIRIPSHSRNMAVSSEAIVKRNGDYYEITPEKDSIEIVADFRMEPRIKRVSPIARSIEPEDWYFERWYSSYAGGSVDRALFVKESRYIISYGPLLLAKSKLMGLSEEDIFGKFNIEDDLLCKATPISAEGIRCALDLTFGKGDSVSSVRVCDFASASSLMSDDARLFDLYF